MLFDFIKRNSSIFYGLEILDRWSIYLSGLLFMGLFHIANATSLTGLMDEFEKNKGAANALAIP